MRVLAANPGHDGAVAWIEDGSLIFSLEAEKDSNPRHAGLGPELLLQALELAGDFPDVVALGGWGASLDGQRRSIGAGYSGVAALERRSGRLFGREVSIFSSSHKRGHVFGALGMSSFGERDAAVLVWEGAIGSLFRWHAAERSLEERPVLAEPGARYACLFALADPSFPERGSLYRPSDAGKLMALAGLADPAAEVDAEVEAAVDLLLRVPTVYPFEKAAFAGSPLHNAGVEDPRLHQAALQLTDRIFQRFRSAAVSWLPAGLPLAIAGGCALNCDWNSRWAADPHFSEVSVAPTGNDSGAALGAAVDALHQHGEPAAIEWDAYRGAEFCHDREVDPSRWSARPLEDRALAETIAEGALVAWVQGRAEIGPRALGHRSLLASAHRPQSHGLLNEVKRRESYRPIAPCCLEEEHDRWFDGRRDPHMLFFSWVKTDRLPAVTHLDGTARVQAVRPSGPSRLRSLLRAVAAREGAGVLCNTSLNFSGRGFVNRTSDLERFCADRGIRHFVIGEHWYSSSNDG